MKKTTKILNPILSVVLIAALVVTLLPTHSAAAGKVKLNKTNLTITVGKTQTLKLKNNKKKVTWSSNKKKVATVNQKGKVTAKKKGTATITAKVGKKKYKCKVTVKAATTKNNENTNNTTTTTPSTTPTIPTPPPTPTPVSGTDITNNYAKLKSYIQAYGSTNSSGNKFIKYDDSQYSYGIVYNANEASFSFIFSCNSSTSSDVLSMDISESDLNKGNLKYITLFYSSQVAAILNTSGDINAINANTKFTWAIDTNYNGSVDTYAMLQDLGNATFALSYYGWDTLLNQSLGLSMTDFGFAR